MAKKETTAPAVQADKFLRKTIVGDVITFTLQNGLKVVFDLTKLHKDCEQTAKMHGISQVIGDTAAKFSKEKDFHGAFSAMQQKADNLEAGVWSARGTGSADLAQALVNLGLGTLEDVEAGLKLASDEERDDFLDDDNVKAEILKIKAARAAQKAATSEPSDLKKLWKAFSTKGAAV